MRKIYLHVIMLFLGVLNAHGQIKLKPIPTDSNNSNYQSRKLKIDEVNLVSAYYNQTGNNSAVTGGIGTEKLTDVANTIDIQMSKFNKKGRKNTFLFELGIDHYTSASSDKIDPSTISSASSSDTRIYPSLNWTHSNESTGNSFGFTGSYSGEYDYQSMGAGFNLTRLSKNKNTQFDFKLQAFLDSWTVILPIELRSGNGNSHESRNEGRSPRNSFSSSFSLSQVINQKLQAILVVEPSFQKGLLATKYQRNYFTDGSLQSETLPNQRFKFPIAVRLNYFATDQVIVRTFYRFYRDNWGITAHTAELEVPVKLSSFISLSPFYRYNKQTGTRYFAGYGQHTPGTTYFTSDYDLASLNSDFYGIGIRVAPPKGVLGLQRLSMMELRYGHYSRSTGLASNVVSLNIKVK